MNKFRLVSVGIFLFIPLLYKTGGAAASSSSQSPSSNVSSSPVVPTLLRLVTNQPYKPVNKPKLSLTQQTSSQATNTLPPTNTYTTSHIQQYYHKQANSENSRIYKKKEIGQSKVASSEYLVNRSDIEKNMQKLKLLNFSNAKKLEVDGANDRG